MQAVEAEPVRTRTAVELDEVSAALNAAEGALRRLRHPVSSPAAAVALAVAAGPVAAASELVREAIQHRGEPPPAPPSPAAGAGHHHDHRRPAARQAQQPTVPTSLTLVNRGLF